MTHPTVPISKPALTSMFSETVRVKDRIFGCPLRGVIPTVAAMSYFVMVTRVRGRAVRTDVALPDRPASRLAAAVGMASARA